MFSKNLKYYRLRKNMTKKQLASLAGVTPMSISHYENGERKPGMDVIRKLAKALDVRVSDFLSKRNENLTFIHGEFRKKSKLSESLQEYIRESVEEYMNRFFTIVDVLGGEVLPEAPACHGVNLSGDVEQDAKTLREYLHISENGPIGNLVELLENKGVLVCFFDFAPSVMAQSEIVQNTIAQSEITQNKISQSAIAQDTIVQDKDASDAFSGMNGLVNGRPYIIVNKNMSPERIRSTIVHEMAHFMFVWQEDMEEKLVEDYATAISGAFLFPREDARRELGIRRSAVTKDMALVCKEYGISMYLLVKRANLCGILTDRAAKDFYVRAGQHGWKKAEPVRIAREEPMLFSQLVFRAVSEHEISVQKGAELLGKPYDFVAEQCFAAEG